MSSSSSARSVARRRVARTRRPRSTRAEQSALERCAREAWRRWLRQAWRASTPSAWCWATALAGGRRGGGHLRRHRGVSGRHRVASATTAGCLRAGMRPRRAAPDARARRRGRARPRHHGGAATGAIGALHRCTAMAGRAETAAGRCWRWSLARRLRIEPLEDVELARIRSTTSWPSRSRARGNPDPRTASWPAS